MTDTRAATRQDEEHGTAEELGQALDRWRARIDELLVQVDLAGLDVRESVQRSLGVAENVYLAIRSQLARTGRDAGAGGEEVLGTCRSLLGDLRSAVVDAEAVVRRSCADGRPRP